LHRAATDTAGTAHLARTLGADKAMRTPSQLFRMPAGLRDGFIVDQPILFFNPHISKSNE
jgi:hypothetical protein